MKTQSTFLLAGQLWATRMFGEGGGFEELENAYMYTVKSVEHHLSSQNVRTLIKLRWGNVQLSDANCQC